jgi:cyclophilin family peptidyl-prolyl cis-trans isomerase
MKKFIYLIVLILIVIGVSMMTSKKVEEVAIISTKYGDMVIEFYPEIAPMHVESFKILANEGYFNGTLFHRVIPGFVIQGGDPNSKLDDRSIHGTGGRAGKFFGIGDENDSSTWLIPQEFNATPHVKGTLSMARTNDPNSASSQFFICHDVASFLDNNYTVFGQVIDGLETIDAIVNLEKDLRDNPLEKVDMQVKIINKDQLDL